MAAPVASSNPAFPYTCVQLLNMDTVVVFFTIQSVVSDRRARLIRPATSSDPVHIAVETTAESLGRMPSPLQARVGTPWAGLTATSYLDQDVPFQLLVQDAMLGALVLGAAPSTVVSTTPVALQWSQAPNMFPPAIQAAGPALRLRPACSTIAPRTKAAFTGLAYSVVDNTVSANELRAMPVSDVIGGSTLFTLAWCPPSSSLGYTVLLTLAWPGSTSVPASRTEYWPVVPRRCPGIRFPTTDPLTDSDPVQPAAPFSDKPLLRLPPPSDPLRLPVQTDLPVFPRRRFCYPLRL